MAKTIVVLNGSPRPKGNTAALIDQFRVGAESAGHLVTTFHLDEMEIDGCKGCWEGGRYESSPCTVKDDMDGIYPMFRVAEVVVLASPMYYWGISGQLKTTLDRLFALTELNEYQSPVKDCILLMAAGDEHFDEVTHYYEGLVKRMGWNNLGMVLAGGVTKIGDIKGKPELKKARRMGAGIV